MRIYRKTMYWQFLTHDELLEVYFKIKTPLISDIPNEWKPAVNLPVWVTGPPSIIYPQPQGKCQQKNIQNENLLKMSTEHFHARNFYHWKQMLCVWIEQIWSFHSMNNGLSTNLAEDGTVETGLRGQRTEIPHLQRWLQTGFLLSSQHPKLPFPSGQQSIPDLNMKQEPGHFEMNGKELRNVQKHRIASRMLAKEICKFLWLGKKGGFSKMQTKSRFCRGRVPSGAEWRASQQQWPSSIPGAPSTCGCWAG